MDIGIDWISVYVPKLRIQAKELAESRDIDNAKALNEKYVFGLGVNSFAVPNSDEDVSTMAANSLIKLIKETKIEPKDIGRIFVATESSFDISKPVLTYSIDVLESLFGKGSFEHVFIDERKFACVSGMSSLDDAINWVKEHKKKAVVITSDIAKYDLRSPGEPTSGAGAVAILVSENPRLISIDPYYTTYTTTNKYDFYKPMFNLKDSKLGAMETPVVDGHYSEIVYEQTLFITYRKLEEELEKNKIDPFDIDYIVVHIPFVKMAKKAFANFLLHKLREYKNTEYKQIMSNIYNINNELLKEPFIKGIKNLHESFDIALSVLELYDAIENFNKFDIKALKQKIVKNINFLNNKIGKEYIEQFKILTSLEINKQNQEELEKNISMIKNDIDMFLKNYEGFIRAFMKTDYYKKELEKQGLSSQMFTSYIGNIYTGSIFLGLYSLIVNEAKKRNIANKRIWLGGYGSGAGAIGLFGKIMDRINEFTEITQDKNIFNGINLDINTYEKLHRGLIEKPIFEENNEDKIIVLDMIRQDGKREYSSR